MFPGARNFRSLAVSGTCDGVRCAIAVTRDIGSSSASPRDQINVAQVYRLQARGEVDGNDNITAGGNIYADVTAGMSADDFAAGSAFGGQYAIGYILAGQSIQGAISATGAPPSGSNTELRNGIAKLLVGLGAIQTGGTVFGITGDIKAERGGIGTVWCNGPIGTVSHHSQIRAGNRLDELRVMTIDPATGTFAFDPNTGRPLPAAYDISADIVTDLEVSVPTGQSFHDGRLAHLETDGGFTGSIEAGSLR